MDEKSGEKKTNRGRKGDLFLLPSLFLDWFVGGTASQDPIRQSTNPCHVIWQRRKRRGQRTSYKREGVRTALYVRRPREEVLFFLNSKKKVKPPFFSDEALANKSSVFFPERNVFPLEQVRCEPSELHYSTEPRHYSPSGTIYYLF
jgi:hypothetical protein